MYAASAIAANTIARSACGAAAPLFTNQMFSALGVGGGGSLIGGVAALLACIPFAFYKYGGPIRVRSRFAPTSENRTEHNTQEKSDEETPPEAVEGPASPCGDESAASQTTAETGSERG